MLLEDIQELHTRHNRPGFGTTTVEELDYIQRLIQKHKPKRVLEIGTASGLTTGFIAQFLEENGGSSVTSVDLATTFFGARDQPVGYLARKIYDGSKVEIDVRPRTSALDLAEIGGSWDMAFIDANHQHPWPTIDTLAVAAHLRGPRIVIHHDLQLYRRYKRFRGVGPRVLFNEMPEENRHADIANGWNIFSLDLTLDPVVIEHVAIGAFSMPWTVQPPLTTRTFSKINTCLKASYSAQLLAEFEECAAINKRSLPVRAFIHLKHEIARRLADLGLRK